MGEPEVHGTEGPLIDLPHRGNRLAIECRECGRQALISGQEICLRFTSALARPIEEWAMSLSCGACRSRWILVACEADPDAQGFQTSTQDTGQVIWARRLSAYLAGVGKDIEAYRGVLRELPTKAEMADLKRPPSLDPAASRIS